MKKIFMSLCTLLMAGTMSLTAQSYELRVLTFEDANVPSAFAAETYDGAVTTWSEMIPAADDQGSPAILYAGGMGDDYPYYWWHDGGNTELFSEINEGYGTYCYWSGGEAVSNIWTSDYETYNYYTSQFTAYRPGLADDNLNTTGGGHNGSDNFCVHFGYIDNSEGGWGLDHVDAITFADGVARVIDHVYICPTTYTYYCITSGNDLTDALGEEGRIIIQARGFASASDAEPSATSEFVFFDGQGTATLDWTKWDLYELGEIEKLEFTMYGEGLGTDNGYGLSQPAYFAWDDMAVRFPVATPEPEPTTYERTGLTAGNFGTICLPYSVAEGNYTGATFYRVAERSAENVTLEEVTSLTAGVAYIFQATATTLTCTYTEGTKVTTPATATTANVLQGVFADNTTIPAGTWFLSGNQLWASTGAQTADAYRAYLTNLTPNVASVPGRRLSMPMQAQTPTAVNNVENEETDAIRMMLNGNVYIRRNGMLYDMKGNRVK